MRPWTEDARRFFEEQCERRRADLLGVGADPDEVFADWRAHVIEATAAGAAPEVTAGEVKAVLDRLDAEAPPSVAEPPPLLRSDPPALPVRPLSLGAAIVLGLFGVLLPLLTLVIEALTSMCANTLLDPIPNWVNGLLIAVVPLANGLAIGALRGGGRRGWRTAGWLNGLAVAVAFFYALMFAVVTPFAVVAIIFFGIGFLPLAPLLSFVCALVLRRRMKIVAAAERRPAPAAFWKPILAALALLSIAAAPRVVTLSGVHMAVSEDPAVRARGLRLLRTLGDEEQLLRAAYLRRAFQADPLVWLYELRHRPVSIERVREVYYRVTGRPFNSVRPPPMRGRRGMIFDDAEWDFDQAGDRVSARLQGLSLSQSRLDGRVEAAAGVAYLEWTLVFRNEAEREREARALLRLPAGGVVSRLTLWINGEEREAAFGGRSQVREAYEKVVRRRRDPVLVTTAGPDRVLVQCYPVPAGGTMKTRIGVTVPLALASREEAALALPRILESNFAPAADLTTSVWIEGDGEFVPPAGLSVAQPADGRYALRGDAPGAQVEEDVVIACRRPAVAAVAWSRDDRAESESVVLQHLVERPAAAPERLAIVVDGSRRMQSACAELREIFGRLPPGIPARVFVASDEVLELEVSADAVNRLRFAGGCDNAAALVRAWDWAAAEPRGAVLWLHATQPFESDSVEALSQRWERSPAGPPVYARQFGGGPDRLTEKLGRLTPLREMPLVRGGASDVASLLDAWAGRKPLLGWERTRLPAGQGAPGDAVKASAHVVRLMAADEVRRLGRSRAESDRLAAVALARRWQLVTEVSGAVVLETQEQYRAAGLDDVDPATTPEIIPEPASGALALIGTALLFILRGARRCRNAGAMPAGRIA